MESYWIGYVFGLVIAAFLALIPANIAKRKGHSFGLWWFYGWMLFIVAIIHVQFIEDRSNLKTSNYPPQTVPPYYENPYAVQNQKLPAVQTETVDALKQYKDLLDSGVITQEEFDAKKKQILGL